MLNHAAGLGKAIIRYIIMTIVDAIIIIIVLGGLVIGYRKGLITQLASLV